jgi:hypothetical protein
MALSHVNGLAAGSAPELRFRGQGRHVLCRETWLTGGALLPDLQHDLAAGVPAQPAQTRTAGGLVVLVAGIEESDRSGTSLLGPLFHTDIASVADLRRTLSLWMTEAIP